MEKYFMHRIKKENGVFTTGIEVHNTKESAIRSFHGYMKQGYNNPSYPNITYIACKVQNAYGRTEDGYDASWLNGEEDNKIFFHYIRFNGDTVSKNIDVYDDVENAEYRFHSEMEYGYDNSKFPNVSYVSCMITELMSNLMLKTETWEKTNETVPESDSSEEDINSGN